jgi:hypothetical protein
LGLRRRKVRARCVLENHFLFQIVLQKDLKIVQINLEFECRGGYRGNNNTFIV